MKIIEYQDLPNTDLFVDAIYEGGQQGNAGDDPISKLIPGIGNMAGFRYSGSGDNKKIIVLYTSGDNKDWPDEFENSTGKFIYYGDNKTPGHELHDTPRKGNQILRRLFHRIHSGEANKRKIPPIFVFEKFPTKNSSRSVQFKGLVVPGHASITGRQDLVAIWKTTDNQRFQNYRSVFTIIDCGVIKREWINDIVNGKLDTENCPKNWLSWINGGVYIPLVAQSTTLIRSIKEQTPSANHQISLLRAVFKHFEKNSVLFESFAARIFQMYDSNVIIDEVTRATMDGGRDAVGRYVLGLNNDPVYVEFALEAKCYRPGINGSKPNTVGVKEIARLISRLKHRQFGVLVTTSAIAKQAYTEVREDRHPVVFLTGIDICNILIDHGYSSVESVEDLLTGEFPI